MIHDEECKECYPEGCGLRPVCVDHETMEIIHCPCKLCMIKMMCSVSCPKFDEYVIVCQEYWRNKRKELNQNVIFTRRVQNMS